MRSCASAVLLATVLATSPGLAQALRKSAPPVDPVGALILLRSSLTALDHANKTGNYTVLRDLGSSAFQANTAAQLTEIFANQRRAHLDLAFVSVLDPKMTAEPQIDSSGLLHLSGMFAVAPAPVTFELIYAPQDGQWRLFGLSVGVVPAVAQQQEPAPAQRQSNMKALRR